MRDLSKASLTERAQHAYRSIGLQHGVVLVSKPSDVRWLCGFTGSNGAVVLDIDSARLHMITDSRYQIQAMAEAHRAGLGDEFVVNIARTDSEINEVIRNIANSRPVYVDAQEVTLSRFNSLVADLHDVQTMTNPLGEVRRCKSDEEIERIAFAADIADQALDRVLTKGICGLTERQVRIELDFEMLALGADDVSFETIVATGANAAMPHHRPGNTVIEAGHLVIIDMGALFDGYHSDMTRTVKIGDVSESMLQLLEVTIASQRAGVAAIRHGAHGKDIDMACRMPMRDAGLEDLYIHGTGHGVGLDIHEEPFFGPRSTAELRTGEVVTVEPGLYRGGVGGARIEDLVLVTPSGCRILTNSPKDLSCPPSPRTT